MGTSAAVCHNWKLLSSSTAQSSGPISRSLSSRLPPILPPSQARNPWALSMVAVMAAVVDLPFEPVTPITLAGQARRKRPISVSIFAPACRAISSIGLPGRTAGLTTTSSALSKILFTMSPQVQPGDVYALQPFQRIGQGLLFGDVGHGDFRPWVASHLAAAAPPPKHPSPMTVTRRPR